MKRQTYLPLLCLWLISASALFSAPIQNLKFTDVVKEVKILNVATKAETTAKVGDVLVPPNVIKTGADSRAELVAEDQTVTRVGANTIFSVEANSRDVNIAKGSVLFHSPAGKGGGNIKSAGATASVLGTTLIVGANQSGGFKVMLLEGKGQVTGAGGGGTKLTAGQMSFAMPGQAPSQPLNFELKGQVSGSKLVGGFSKPLASIAKIEAAVSVQQAKIASGDMASTGLMIGSSPSVAFKLDPAVIQVTSPSIQITAQAVRKAKEAVARARVEQAKTEAARIEQSRQILDPRFLVAVSRDLALRTNTTPATHEQPIPLTLEKFTANNPFSGNYTIGKGSDAGWGAPASIPGNRQEKNANPSGDLTMLLANEIDFNITPSTGESPGIFAIAPLFDTKNYNGVVALKDISFNGSVDFVERMVDSQAGDGNLFVLENLFLSAGNTINAKAGTVIKSSSARNFDIYAGGTGFSGANSRTGFFAPASGGATPLALTDTMIWNALNLETATDGNLSIEAPSINFRNVTLSAGHSEGRVNGEEYFPPATISLTSPGNIELKVDTSKLALVESYPSASSGPKTDLEAEAVIQKFPLPLGFVGPELLAIQAFNVSLVSAARAITITGVPIYSNRISISTGNIPVFEASAFAPSAGVAGGAGGHANKLYIPAVKYDRDANASIDPDELSAAQAALIGKAVSGSGVAAETKISNVVLSSDGRIVLVLDRDVEFTGFSAEGTIDSISAEGTIDTIAGTFTTGAIMVGSSAQYSAGGNISISNITPGGLIRGGTPLTGKDPLMQIEAAGNIELKNLLSRTVNGAVTNSNVLILNSVANWEKGFGVFDVNGTQIGTVADVDREANRVTLSDPWTLSDLDTVSAGVSQDQPLNDFSGMINVNMRAMGSVALENSRFSPQSNLNVWADQDITFKGVSITGPDSNVSGKLSAVSNSKSVYLNTKRSEMEALKVQETLIGNNLGTSPQKVVTRTVMQAKAVHFTADNGDIFVNGVSFEPGYLATGSEFQARAKGTIGIYDSAINHAKVAIAANTVVLKDVQFHADSLVRLYSKEGMVSGNPGYRTSVVQGNVNILSNVKHGDYTIRFMNDGSTPAVVNAVTANTSSHLNPSQFQDLLPADKKGKVSVGAR